MAGLARARPRRRFAVPHAGHLPLTASPISDCRIATACRADRAIRATACAATTGRTADRVDIFLQQIVNGLTLGSVYAVVALGYTMVYGIIQLINFAHGEVVMIGAMVAFSVIIALAGAHTGLPPLAIVRRRRRWSRFRCAWPSATRWSASPTGRCARAPRLAPLITAIGLSIILQHLAMIIWSRNPLPFPQIIEVVPYHITGNPDGATITNVQIAIIVTSVAMMGGLLALVYRTKLGIAMRATSQNQQVAGLMGIDINRVISLTFVIGAALGAVAGVMVGTYYGIAHYQMGFMLGLKAFSAAVLGGIGNLARRDAGRRAARPDRGARRGLRRRPHQPVPARRPGRRASPSAASAIPTSRCSAATTRTCSRSSC